MKDRQMAASTSMLSSNLPYMPQLVRDEAYRELYYTTAQNSYNLEKIHRERNLVKNSEILDVARMLLGGMYHYVLWDSVSVADDKTLNGGVFGRIDKVKQEDFTKRLLLNLRVIEKQSNDSDILLKIDVLKKYVGQVALMTNSKINDFENSLVEQFGIIPQKAKEIVPEPKAAKVRKARRVDKSKTEKVRKSRRVDKSKNQSIPAANLFAELQSIENELNTHEMDVISVLEMPLMTDMGFAPTREFRTKLAYVRTVKPEVSEMIDVNNVFINAVGELRVMWEHARSEAKRISLARFSSGEKDLIERARKLMGVALSGSLKTPERQAAYRQAVKCLEGLIVIPEVTMNSLAAKTGFKEITSS